jgi:hypothetical protein
VIETHRYLLVPLHYGCHWACVKVDLQALRKSGKKSHTNSESVYEIIDSLYSPRVPGHVVKDHFNPFLLRLTFLLSYIMSTTDKSWNEEDAIANINSLRIKNSTTRPKQPDRYKVCIECLYLLSVFIY